MNLIIYLFNCSFFHDPWKTYLDKPYILKSSKLMNSEIKNVLLNLAIFCKDIFMHNDFILPFYNCNCIISFFFFFLCTYVHNIAMVSHYYNYITLLCLIMFCYIVVFSHAQFGLHAGINNTIRTRFRDIIKWRWPTQFSPSVSYRKLVTFESSLCWARNRLQP
jgi:hypothetical protein